MSKVTCEKTFVNNGIRSNRNIYTDFNNSKFFKIYTKLFTQFNPNQACVLSLIYDRISLSYKHPKQYYSQDKSDYFVIFSRGEIASRLSISESTVGRIISYLRDLGYLDTKRIYNGGLCIFCPCYKYNPKKKSHTHTYSAKASKLTPHIDYSSEYKSSSAISQDSALHMTMPKPADANKISNLDKTSSNKQSQQTPSYLKNNGLLLNYKDVNINPTLQKINNDIHKAGCRYTDNPNTFYDNKDVHYVDPRKASDRRTYSFSSLVDAFHGYRQYDIHHHLMVVPRDDAVLDYMKAYPSVSEYTFAKIYAEDKLHACEEACSTDYIPKPYLYKLCRQYKKSRVDILDMILAHQKVRCSNLQKRIMAYYQPRLDAYTHSVAVKSAISKNEDSDALRKQTRRNHYSNLEKHMHKIHADKKPSKHSNIESRLQYAYNLSKSSHKSLNTCVHQMFPTLQFIPLECKGIQGRHRAYVRIINAPNVAKSYGWSRLNDSAGQDDPAYTQDAIDNQYLHDCLLQRIKVPSNVITALARSSHHCPIVAQTYIGVLYESKYHAFNAIKHKMKPSSKNDAKLLKNAFSFEQNEFYDTSGMSIARTIEDVTSKFDCSETINHWQSYLFTALEKFFEKAGIMYIKHHSTK